jgi:histidinol-phosphate phosphatase family protein
VTSSDRGALAPLVLCSSKAAPLDRRRAAAFLDRDGVLNEAVADPLSGAPESPLAVADVSLIPGAGAAARRLASAGYAVVCVTNQPAAAKGKITVEELLAVHRRVLELLVEEAVCVEATFLCPHHPDGVVAELSGPCMCRKPAPGMLLDAAAALNIDLARSWMFGDTDADVAAGRAAGTRTVLVEYPGSRHKRSPGTRPSRSSADLRDGVAQVLDRGRR